MKTKGTSWSSPKKNFILGLLDLRIALGSGYKARLIREYNENCEFPIKIKTEHSDFRCYESTGATLRTPEEVRNDKNMSDAEKYITLNYVGVFGTKEARDHYYATGELTKDNSRGMGVSHLVKRKDLIDFLIKNNETERAHIISLREGERQFIDTIRLKSDYDIWNVPKFKRKLWVVQLLSKDDPQPKIPVALKILNVLMSPLKWIPKKSVLRMKEYKQITFRVGDVVNGFSLEIQIPKKFSF